MQETEKAGYAPRYVIQHQVVAQCPNCGNTDCAEIEAYKTKVQEQWIAEERLKDSIVEAAEKYRAAELNSSRDLICAVDKLLDFESQHGKR